MSSNENYPPDDQLGWVQLACQPSVVKRALRISIVVGTLLTLINQLPALLENELSTRHVLQILLTYLVPYCVSTYSAVSVFTAQNCKKSPSGNGRLK